MSLLVYTLNWLVTGYCVMLPLKELKDYQFCIIGGWGDLRGLSGTIVVIGGLWRLWGCLRAIGSGGKAPLWDFHDNFLMKSNEFLMKSIGFS